MAASVMDKLWSVADIVSLIEKREEVRRDGSRLSGDYREFCSRWLPQALPLQGGGLGGGDGAKRAEVKEASSGRHASPRQNPCEGNIPDV